MKTIQVDFEVSNDYEYWNDDKQLSYLEKHKKDIIEEAYENIVISMLINGQSM